MRKLIKLLLLADISMIVTGLILYQVTVNRDDTWGYAVGYPLIGVTITTLAIIVLIFSQALRSALFASKLTLIQKFGCATVLLGVPLLGMVYASNGENRTSLWILSFAFLGAGCIGLIYILREGGNSKHKGKGPETIL